MYALLSLFSGIFTSAALGVSYGAREALLGAVASALVLVLVNGRGR